jgi:diguanylate cyclase (GGDEF)-like protein
MSSRLIRSFPAFLGLLLLCGLMLGTGARAQAPVLLSPDTEIDLMSRGQLFLAETDDVPPGVQDLPGWLERQKVVNRVNLFGGHYWFHAAVQNDTAQTKWVIDPSGTLIEHVDVFVYLPGQPTQSFATGYRADTAYMAHYGGDVTLPPGSVAQVLLRIDSRYFARYPSVYAATQASYRKTVISENVLILSALGAMAVLALYNLFVYFGVRDRAMLYYACYLLCATVSWGLTFNLGSDLFEFRQLGWHYTAFVLGAIFNTLFYLSFLQLKNHAPKLTLLSRLNIGIMVAMLPVCFFSIPYAHFTATAVISTTLTLALVSGMVRLGQGFLPSRYYLAAFFALLLPALLILPANFGLVPSMVRNVELLTLLGQTADGVLLAFALADKIRLLGREKDAYVTQLDQALTQASTDSLTGIANRHAFDRALGAATSSATDPDVAQHAMLVMIDLDGLKRINDEQGHAHGDRLLRDFARQLETLTARGMSVFRIGGDEFAVLGERHQEEATRRAIHVMEETLHADGFSECGISYGIAFGSEINSGSQLLMHADARMYLHKTTKKGPPVARAPAPEGRHP